MSRIHLTYAATRTGTWRLAGVHHCLGNHLGRLNMEIMFNTILRRLPGLKPAMGADEHVENRHPESGLVTLPVKFQS